MNEFEGTFENPILSPYLCCLLFNLCFLNINQGKTRLCHMQQKTRVCTRTHAIWFGWKLNVLEIFMPKTDLSELVKGFNTYLIFIKTTMWSHKSQLKTTNQWANPTASVLNVAFLKPPYLYNFSTPTKEPIFNMLTLCWKTGVRCYQGANNKTQVENFSVHCILFLFLKDLTWTSLLTINYILK